MEAGKTPDDQWRKAVQKGRHLLNMMIADDRTAGQMLTPPSNSAESQFLKYEDTGRYEYTKKDYGGEVKYPITALRAIGADDKPTSEGGKNEAVMYARPDWTYFGMSINVTDGIIFALSAYSPSADAAPSEGMPLISVGSDDNELPAMRFWSDIAFLHWSHSVPNQVAMTGLKHVFQCSVQNPQTEEVISRILNNRGQHLTAWPGITVDTNTEEGQALLGSPNGSGAAFLLIQHKRQLGHKVVDRITIFWDEQPVYVQRWPSLLLHIRDVEGPEGAF